MQHIALNLINEKNELIQRSEINFVPVMKMMWSIEDCEKNYPFLVGIDPYGHTYFNVHQAPKVIEELKNLKKEKMFEAAIKETDDSIKFLKKVEQHTFVNFIGD